MWSWVAHRITGVTLFFFLFAHVIDTSMVRVSPEAYNTAVEAYKNPIVGLMEVGLVAAFLFHGLNGIRISLVGSGLLVDRQRALFVAAVALTIVIGLVGGVRIFLETAP